ncbi:MAG: AraC family transcriptional regulator, partial [Gammaproteobacteria bacterium]|nr:AraC family transcriptional regulator [Gammaproteobacteria bacterium]
MCLNIRMREFTIAIDFVRMMLEGAEKQGVNCDHILLAHGISKLALSSERPRGNSRVPLESFAAVAVEVMRLLDDECLGLMDRKQPLGSFNMLCRACISAKTIKRSIKRTAHYWNLFENTYRHKVLISGGRVFYEMELIEGKQTINSYAVEAILSSIHRFHCWLGGQFIPLISVSMDYPEPTYSNEYRPLFYGAPIKYRQPYCQLEFESRYLGLDIVQTADTLDQYLAGTNLSLLYQPKHYRVISDQVRQWLEKNIKQGNYQATLKQAAANFQISQQVLHRRLQAEDTSFKEIKMQTRRDIAINLLFSEKHKIEEIA